MSELNNEFTLKILSGGKVILANCPGYEPEIFIPHIVNNRISLENVIVERWCCRKKYVQATKTLGRTAETSRHSCRSSLNQQTPLANSTPARTYQSVKKSQSPLQRHQTPEIVRRAVVQDKNVSVTIPGLAPGLKIVRLHRYPTPNAPNKLAKIVPSSRASSPMVSSASQSRILRNLSNVSSFRTLPSLDITSEELATKSPNQADPLGGIMPMSVTKWRKCITPMKTYIRRKNNQKTPLKAKTLSVKPLVLGKRCNLLQDFCPNPTKHPPGNEKVVFRRRKMVVDASLTITPKTFKNQLKHTNDLKRTDFQLPKSRRDYICSQQTAFDLLTNSCYYPRISKKINAVFRQGCLKKRAETILKYKQLINDITS